MAIFNLTINSDAAANMDEGAIVGGIGHALYGEMTFKDGVPEKSSFRHVSHNQA